MDETKQFRCIVLNERCPYCNSWLDCDDNYSRTNEKMLSIFHCSSCNIDFNIKSHITGALLFKWDNQKEDYIETPVKEYDTYNDDLEASLNDCEDDADTKYSVSDETLSYDVRCYYEPYWLHLNVKFDGIEEIEA